MGIQTQLISTACIVYFGLTYVQPHNQLADQAVTTSQVNDGSKIQGSLQNLFDSITKNDAKKGEVYRAILNQGVAKERQTFDSMKEELRVARNGNANKRKNFSGKNIRAVKRQTSNSGFPHDHPAGVEGIQDHQHHEHQFEHYADHDPKNESIEWEIDEQLCSDRSYHNLIETVLQLWWSQRGFVHNIRHENEELRRLKYVVLNRVNDELDHIEEVVEKQIGSMDFWNKPETASLDEVMNMTVLAELDRKWRSAYDYFVIYELEGAQKQCASIRHELTSAREDLKRRWERIQAIMIELQEQEQQKKDDEMKQQENQ